jgi:radical SAM superfamily enzyme with C-terminal helix-hairpin-helix motif
MAFEGTDMADTGAEIAKDHKQLFKQYKQEVRETIDNPMLQRVAPPGTILPDVHLEYHQDGKTFGRQLGTYPLLVGIPGERELGSVVDIAVTDHGYRSVTGVPHPLDLNSASMNELTAIPGIGRSTAGDVVVNRPYESAGDIDVDAIERFVTAQSPEGAD